MRANIALFALLASCTKAPSSEPDPVPAPVPPGPKLVDAGVADAPPVPSDAPTQAAPTPIRPLAMAGPYKTIDDSCAAARPCGEIGDANGGASPATTPDCTAVSDPSRNPIATVPMTMG